LEDNKKGQRDISDLKARLGLKKTGVMPAVSSTGQPAAPAQPGQQGTVPPPIGKPIPPPFGQPAAEPEPVAAEPADPRRDPFAQQQAANLAAFYGIGQVLPGSAEGVSDAPISKPKPWGRIGLVAGIALATFVVGNLFGGVYASRVEFNRTIDQAVTIRAEVDRVAKQVGSLTDVIKASEDTKKGIPDFAMTKKLAELDLKKPDTTKLFRTNYARLEDIAIERLFTYYNESIKLFDLVALHAKRTEADQASIESFVKSAGKDANKNYGVIIDASKAVPVGSLVEVGSPVCSGGGECGANNLTGFKYRTEAGGAWSERPIKGLPSATVTPIQQTALFKAVAQGNPDILAMQAYNRRLAEITELMGKIQKGQKDVDADLKRAGERPHVFTF